MSSVPCRPPFHSTALMELEPMSRPTSCSCLLPPNISPAPFATFNLPKTLLVAVWALQLLSSSRLCLAHLAFHPAIQNRFPQPPTIPHFFIRNHGNPHVAIHYLSRDSQV